MADTFSWIPDYGCEAQYKPSTRAVQFNDGYEQRQNYGINVNPESWPLTFSMRPDTETAAIDAFFKAHVGVVFSWTTPYGDTFLFKCASWNKKKERFNLNTISCTFEQRFES